MSEIRMREGIKVKGHRGTWYVIDEREYDGRTLYMVEHETYGDEAASLIIDEDFNLIADEIWNGWEDYEYLLENEPEMFVEEG